MKYCSQHHQTADWQIHKLLCKSFAYFQERPGDDHRRAISLPENSKKPLFVWIPIVAKDATSSEHAGGDEELSSSNNLELDKVAEETGWEDARADPTGYLNYDSPLDESTDGSSDISSPADEEQLSQGVELCLRNLDEVRSDKHNESKPNKCVAVLTNNRVGHHFHGPMVLYGLSNATGSMVDLETTFLTLAINMFPIWDEQRRVGLSGVGVILEADLEDTDLTEKGTMLGGQAEFDGL
jgi:hypothetical protein